MFPVFSSILAPEAIAQFVRTEYHLQIINCQFWHRGLSDVYLLESSNSSYIFRIYHHHWRNREDIGFELEFLTYLRKNKIPVSEPLISINREVCLSLQAPEGTRYGALFDFAAGAIALGDVNTQQSYLLGTTIAKLHQCSLDFHSSYFREPLDLKFILDNALVHISPFLAKREKELQELHEIVKFLQEQISQLSQQPPYWTTCWGDPHSGNIHFEGNHSLTLFDFDQCGYGYRLFDIAKFWQVAIQSGLSRNIRDEFLRGYQRGESLSSIEISLLNSFTQIAHIWSWSISLNTAKLYDYCRLDDHYFSRRIQHLKRLSSKDFYPRL